MEIHESSFKLLTDKAEKYVNTSIELLKIRAVEKSSFLFSKIIVGLVLSVILTLVLILISIGISLWVGDLLGMPCLGFFIVSACLISLIFLFYRYQNQLISKHVTKLFLILFS